MRLLLIQEDRNTCRRVKLACEAEGFTVESKIDRDFPTKLIRTAYDVGYELADPKEEA